MWRVLVVEDDAQMREIFSGSVSRCGELTLAGSMGTVAEAKAWLDDDEFESPRLCCGMVTS